MRARICSKSDNDCGKKRRMVDNDEEKGRASGYHVIEPSNVRLVVSGQQTNSQLWPERNNDRLPRIQSTVTVCYFLPPSLPPYSL